MFELKQIINKNNNAPEIEDIEMSESLIGVNKYIYRLFSGKITTESEDPGKIGQLYVAVQNVSEFEEKDRYIKCFRITPNMIFETKITGSAFLGQKFKLLNESDMHGYGRITLLASESETGSDGYVVDASEAKTRGRILIRFHCKQ